MKQGKFYIYQDAAGEWRWRLKAGNGKILADSGEGYKTLSGVRRALIVTHNVGEFAKVEVIYS